MNVEAVIWLYVIRSDQGKYYTGITNDIGRRLKEHRGGESKSTKNYRGIELVWTKVFRDSNKQYCKFIWCTSVVKQQHI